MAQLGKTFDANSVEPSTPMEVIPAGKYVVQIINSAMEDTKSGTGSFLKLEMEILEGSSAKRRLFDRLNLINPNTQTAEIAERTLSAICHAVGQLQVSDSEQLHFKPMLVDVRVKPAGPDKQGVMREAQNEMRGYAAVTGARPAPQVSTAPTKATPAPTAAPAASTAPWRRAAG
jgi:hypothetical protein